MNLKFPKRPKYGAKKVQFDGYWFDSKLEREVYGILKLRLLAGEISSIRPQATLYLSASRVPYRADFECTRPDGSKFYVEAKGMETAQWRTKLKLYKNYGPGPLEIWKGSYLSPKLTQVVLPKLNKTREDALECVCCPIHCPSPECGAV